MREITESPLRLPQITPFAKNEEQQQELEDRQSQVIRMYQNRPIRLAEKAIEDYHMYHLDKTRRATTHLYSYLYGWIDSTDIERIIEPFVQTHTRYKLQTSVMMESKNPQRSIWDAMFVTTFRLL